LKNIESAKTQQLEFQKCRMEIEAFGTSALPAQNNLQVPGCVRYEKSYVEFHSVLAVTFSKGDSLSPDDERDQYSLPLRAGKEEVHIFLKKFCLPSLSAEVIVSVVRSSYMVEVGSSWWEIRVSYRFNGCLGETTK